MWRKRSPIPSQSTPLIRRQSFHNPSSENKLIGLLQERGSCTCVWLTDLPDIDEIDDLGVGGAGNHQATIFQIKRIPILERHVFSPCFAFINYFDLSNVIARQLMSVTPSQQCNPIRNNLLDRKFSIAMHCGKY